MASLNDNTTNANLCGGCETDVEGETEFRLSKKCKRDMCTNFEFQFPGKCSFDIMELIFNQLNLVHRIRFSAVCRSWRWVAQHSRITPDFPWLLISHPFKDQSITCNFFSPSGQRVTCNFSNALDQSGTFKFFSASDGLNYSINMPAACGYKCCGSFGPWLIMQNIIIGSSQVSELKDIMVINPFSQEVKFLLPITTMVPWPHAFNSLMIQEPIHPVLGLSRAILSSASNSNFVAAAVDVFGNLHFCRAGDQSWAYYNTEQLFTYKDIIFYEGRFYASILSSIESEIIELYEFDPRLDFKATRHAIPLPMYNYELIQSNHLVELHGDLFLVSGICNFSNDWKPQTVGSMLDFCVFKLDSRRQNWVKVENFGDGIFLLGRASSKSLWAKDYPRLDLKGNYINSGKNCNGLVGFYLEDATVELHLVTSPTLFTPSV